MATSERDIQGQISAFSALVLQDCSGEEHLLVQAGLTLLEYALIDLNRIAWALEYQAKKE